MILAVEGLLGNTVEVEEDVEVEGEVILSAFEGEEEEWRVGLL